MNEKANIITKINNAFYITEKTISWIVFAVMLLLLLIQVFCRYLFEMPLAWAEETVRYTYIGVSFIGAAVASREKSHITIDILPSIFEKIKDEKKKVIVNSILGIFVGIVETAMFVILAMWMFEYVADLQLRNQITTCNQWPMYLMALPVAISCVLIVIHSFLNSIESLISLIGTVKKGE